MKKVINIIKMPEMMNILKPEDSHFVKDFIEQNISISEDINSLNTIRKIFTDDTPEIVKGYLTEWITGIFNPYTGMMDYHGVNIAKNINNHSMLVQFEDIELSSNISGQFYIVPLSISKHECEFKIEKVK